MKRALSCLLVLAVALGGCKRDADDGTAALNKAGLDAVTTGDFDGAIGQFDKLIALKPARADVFKNRGVAYERKGDYDRAIQDFDRAITLDPKFAGAFSNRALAHQLRSEYELAIKDYDAALALKPDLTNALVNRGRTKFYVGRYAEAVEDLQRGARLDSLNPYTRISLHIAASRGGMDDSAAFAAAVSRYDSTKWPAPIANFYRGKLTAAQLLAASATTNSSTRSDQRCASQFYIGEAALWKHDTAQARARFQTAQADCPKDWSEYHGAVVELGRLGVSAR